MMLYYSHNALIAAAFIFIACNIVASNAGTILQDQGNALCNLLSSTNIPTLRDQGKFVGWRCDYSSVYGGYLPHEDNKITVCGNRFLDCNSTAVGSSGCSDKYTNTSELRAWTGITCDDTNIFNVKYLVTHLQLSGRTLTGSCHSSLGKMSALRVLDLSLNYMHGGIAATVDQFASNANMLLQSLRLNNNQFSSTVPTTIGSITSLSELTLYENSLSGVVPTELALLTKVAELNMHSNLFSGLFPEAVFYMPLLTTLNLDTNRLTSLPVISQQCSLLRSLKFSNNLVTTNILQVGNWGTNLPELHTAHLNNNAMTGSIDPTSFGRFVKMQDFRAHFNKLSGTVPDTIGLLTRLEYFHLYHNSLTGTLPVEMGTSTNLLEVVLNNNLLEGPISVAALHTLSRLQRLILNSNLITGELPEGFTQMTSLVELLAQNNQLTGVWPDFSYLKSLQNLDLSYNTFSPAMRLPEGLLGVNCTKLRYFKCISCNLHGSIPDRSPSFGAAADAGSFGDMNSLRSFQLQDNFLNGTIPGSMHRIYNLYEISLQSNDLTGTLPSQLFAYPSDLRYVRLDDNSLSGTIPVSNSQTRGCTGGEDCKLHVLTAKNNILTGSIPNQFFDFNLNLVTVELKNNALTGNIPNGIGRSYDVSGLTTVDFSQNQLTGSIPSSIGSIWGRNHALVTFDVNHNQLTGTLPWGLFNQPNMVLLDVSHNKIQATTEYKPGTFDLKGLDDTIREGGYVGGGSISSSSTYYQNLRTLRLNNNQMATPVPDKFKHFYNLQILDFSNNYFDGSIPSSWSALTHLIELSFGNNNISGQVPASLIANNDGLTVLRMGNNLLEGNIPAIFGTPNSTLKANLETLDISQNRLEGTFDVLGTALGSFNKLKYLRFGSQNFTQRSSELNSSDISWLLTSLARTSPAIEQLDISGLGLHGSIDSTFIAAVSKLSYLDISKNQLEGDIPPSVSSLSLLETFDFSENGINGTLPLELCSMAAATNIIAFPGNLGVECYYPCLVPLLNGIVTNSASVATCATAVPTGQPSGQPTTQPSGLPSGQPSGQPTTSPTHVYYDGKFAQNASLVLPHTVHDVDRRCSGELEVRESALSYGVASTALVTEVWCVEKKHSDEFRLFGVEQQLAADMVRKNAAGISPLLDLSKLRGIALRGKENVVLVSADDSVNPVVSAAASLFRSGACTESGSGAGCVSSLLPFATTPSASTVPPFLWEDSLLACPFFDTQKFGTYKLLPVARAEAWPYGTAAMIQKVRLMESLDGIVIDNADTNADNIDSRVAALFRDGATSLVGAYIMQKGGSIGGWDRVKVMSAKRTWNESALTCTSSASGTAGVETGVIDLLGRDFQFDYGESLIEGGYMSSARSSAIAAGAISYSNVTITHDTLGWSTVDITEILRNQLHWWYLNTPTEPLQLNLLWTPDYAANDRQNFRTHHPREARGDSWGDFDTIVNSTRGRSEWYASESNDPPLLQLFFQ